MGSDRRALSGTTVLFALLVSTVLVTGSIIFMFLWNVVPPHGVRLGAVMKACYARESVLGRPGPADLTPESIAQLDDAFDRIERCVQSISLEQASWTVYGTGVLFGVAGLIYWVCPRWLIRRRRLTPILHEDCPELLDYLVGLARTAGLDGAPVFLIAPYASTSGGLAFGRFRRRYVRLDAGLVPYYITDRAKFRAVVMHELAHLRNRDVDTTYLTMSIWWSFIAVALVPMVVVTLHPRLFITPLRWHPPGISNTLALGLAVLVLTGLIYLTRNAILRVREIHADAHAADDDESRGALRAVVSELRTPGRWRAMTGTHPHPRRRTQAIDDPATVLSPRLWELFAAGLATAMIAANLRYVFTQAMQTLTIFSLVSAGIVCVPGLVAPLVVTVWRATAGTPAHRLSPRALLPMPVVLVAGFLLGEQLSLFSTFTQWTGLVSATSGSS